MTLAMIFSADDGCDVGEDSGLRFRADYGPRATTSTVGSKGADRDRRRRRGPRPPHLARRSAIRVAMARQ